MMGARRTYGRRLIVWVVLMVMLVNGAVWAAPALPPSPPPMPEPSGLLAEYCVVGASPNFPLTTMERQSTALISNCTDQGVGVITSVYYNLIFSTDYHSATCPCAAQVNLRIGNGTRFKTVHPAAASDACCTTFSQGASQLCTLDGWEYSFFDGDLREADWTVAVNKCSASAANYTLVSWSMTIYTVQPTATPTRTLTRTPTRTRTATPTFTATSTPTVTPTVTATKNTNPCSPGFAPPPPSLLSPIGQIEVGLTPLLDWSDIPFEFCVRRFEVSIENSEHDEILRDTTEDSSYTVPQGKLTSGFRYRWKVRSQNAFDDWGNWSEVASFWAMAPQATATATATATRTPDPDGCDPSRVPAAPAPLSPLGDVSVDTTTPQLLWAEPDPLDCVVLWDMRVWDDSATLVVHSNAFMNPFTVAPGVLIPGQRYSWTVQARSRDQKWSAQSSTSFFWVSPTADQATSTPTPTATVTPTVTATVDTTQGWIVLPLICR